MKNTGRWFQRAGMSFTNGIQRFMMGRYGRHDRLNVTLLVVSLILTVASMFLRNKTGVLVTTLLSYVFLFWSLFRCFSRNPYKRYNENRRFLLLIDRIKDRNNRYYCCPKCRQTVRVPRGKGKIAITCPKCREKFIKKT